MRRDDKGHETASVRKRAAILGSFIAVVALGVGSVFGDRGILYLLAQRDRAQQLSRQVDQLREENASLVSDIAALRTDPRAVERVAREQLGLAGPDETVYLIRKPTEP